MKADPTAQRSLLQLAELDTLASQLRHRQKSLPEHARIAALMTERKQLMDDYIAAETKVSDLERELKKSEADLEPVRARRARNQERVDSGAADPKALRSMLDEISHLDRRISDLEAAELELMEASDIAGKHFAMIGDRRRTLEDEIRGLMTERDAQIAALDGEIGDASARRGTLVAGLPDALVARYEKIAAHRGVGKEVAMGPRYGLNCVAESVCCKS